jgi:transcriptional regulator with XRE-family HTH domain
MKKRTSTLPKRIGRAMKARRKNVLAISQEAFAELAGTHRVNYSSIERGMKRIRIDTLEKFSLALKARPWEILKDADEMLPSRKKASA